MFEISIVQRDSLGNPLLTPDGGVRRKLFQVQHADELVDVWARHSCVRKKKKKKDKSSATQNRQEEPKKLETPVQGDGEQS